MCVSISVCGCVTKVGNEVGFLHICCQIGKKTLLIVTPRKKKVHSCLKISGLGRSVAAEATGVFLARSSVHMPLHWGHSCKGKRERMHSEKDAPWPNRS